MTFKGTSEIDYIVRPSGPLRGEIRVPGDKSISHRCVMLAAIADGDTRVRGLLEGEDVLATAAAFRAMGVRIQGLHGRGLHGGGLHGRGLHGGGLHGGGLHGGDALIHGVGREGLRAPAQDIDLGNSGTAMRLLAGLLAGQGFDCSLVGDDSLHRRPMRRITEPLSRMGARIDTEQGGVPPVRIRACDALAPIDYAIPVASAQVKSGVLLAGLYADGRTCVTEPVATRDHTERMLGTFGVAVVRDGLRTCVEGDARLAATEIEVPGDISSAAFFLAAAAGRPGSDLLIRGVGVNPTRTGVLTILERMGADIEWSNRRMAGREPVADLRVRGAVLHGIDVAPALVPLAIDEFPAIFAAAAAARGVTRVTGAAELRVKESDRIAASAEALRTLGVSVRVADDGMEVEGGAISGGEVDSEGDHRIAMAFASSAVTAPVRIRGCRNVATSFPGFETLAGSVGFDIEVVDAGR